MKTLLNNQWWRWVISFIPAPFVFFWAYEFFEPIQYTLITYMPGALISLMGFIITGAAIIVSMRGQGYLKVFAERKPENWKSLMKQFFRASRYCILYTFFLLFADAVPLPNANQVLTRLVYSLSAFGFSLVLLQLSMAMAALEQAANLSSFPVEADSSTKAQKQNSIFPKPDPNLRIYTPQNSSSSINENDIKEDL